MMTSIFENKTILVTGGGGFIGSHLVEQLVNHNARVRVFVRYNARSDPALLRQLPPGVQSQLDVVAGDLRDFNAVQKAVAGCQMVFHLGALISIPYSYHHPVEVVQTNVLGSMNVFLACMEHAVERVIHTSTSEVYGTARSVPIHESHPLQAQSPYSASKIAADKLAESFYCSYGLPVVTVRPFNTYGPRQSTRAVIPTIITQALTRDTIHLGNLETTRDFTYVDDTVNGFIAAAQTPQVEGKVFNLGTGREVKIGTLAQIILKIISSSAEIIVEKQRLRPQNSEVFQLLSNYNAALETLGWQPTISLEEGLEKTIDWIRNHLDLYQIDTYAF